MNDQVIRVLVAEARRAYRRAVRALLERAGDIAVVGEAEHADAALAQVLTGRPDVALVDLRLPGDGIAVVRRIVEAVPHARVLTLSGRAEKRPLLAAINAGACGYVLKGARSDELRRAIRQAHRGEAVIGPVLASHLAERASPAEAPVEPFPDLTGRERQVLDGMIRGLDNAAIATRLSLSPKTVRNISSSVMRKLDVHTRDEAVAIARATGLDRPGSS
ncbi:response regulator transcription factor [Actinomadura kijaniata]|uniref:DNA-binding NarL/FixJ family response regulator n=1 Tax=Actinomadura namibiensis TaxID=182080 RepID=A0A7W3QP06_ACTNM|nr:response regulator transcription factor [Actinomadura namibiensis]MBA8954162.1 DNA-binding NarL/FixJ family response regulator [Actinomadura namibiensis]